MPNREDPSLYQGILVRFAEALLTSKLTALDAAVHSHNQQLIQSAARAYAHFAHLHSLLLGPQDTEPPNQRHHCSGILEYLRSDNVSIQRVRRAPQVIGDERAQLTHFKAFIHQIKSSPHTAQFRQRGDRFVMTLSWKKPIPDHLSSLVLSQVPERTLIHHLAEDWLESYILLLALRQSGIRIRCKSPHATSLSFSWQRARQLQIKL